MFKFNWNGNTAPFIITAIGLILITLFAWTVPYSKGYQRADRDHEADYATHYAAQKDYEKCLTMTTVREAVECTKDAEHAYRENTRAEYNLDAQREMANWAESMLWTTFAIGTVTVIVAGIGTYWIRETLAANRAAAVAANRNNQIMMSVAAAERRPQLTVSIEGEYLARGTLDGELNYPQGNPLAIRARIEIGNIGDQIAEIVRFHAETRDTRLFNWNEVYEILGRDETLVLDPHFQYVGRLDDIESRYVAEQRFVYGHIICTPEEWRDVIFNPPPIIGRVQYLDSAAMLWEYRFAFAPMTVWTDKWKRWGGRQYNGHHEADPQQDTRYAGRPGFPGEINLFGHSTR